MLLVEMLEFQSAENWGIQKVEMRGGELAGLMEFPSVVQKVDRKGTNLVGYSEYLLVEKME